MILGIENTTSENLKSNCRIQSRERFFKNLSTFHKKTPHSPYKTTDRNQEFTIGYAMWSAFIGCILGTISIMIFYAKVIA
ncbi:MAG: hypothetical protein GC181_11260 [Bacteroidetes bacterium]|nr:hypothetical protein [Bacteroidota bacterium]